MSKERLKNILRIQSYSYRQWRMFAYIIRQVSKIEGVSYAVDNGNIYVKKGLPSPYYPCIVAHMDTVHKVFKGQLTVIEVGDLMTGFNAKEMTQSGIGGDDKVGVYLALEILYKYENVKLVFFRDEEVGCHGSDEAGMEFFEDCAFVLQGDRRGNDDFVTNASGTELGSKAWRKALSSTLKKHRYKTAHGMMTDVMTLKDNGLDISCANMSCGYYRPHCDDEYVNWSDVKKCLNLMSDIVDTMCYKRWDHKRESKIWKYGSSTSSFGHYDKNGFYVPPKTDASKVNSRWEDWDSEGGWDKTKRWSDELNDGTGFGDYDESPVSTLPAKLTKLENIPVWGYCVGCASNRMVSYVRSVDDYICDGCQTDYDL